LYNLSLILFNFYNSKSIQEERMKKVVFTLLVLALVVMPVMAQGSKEAASGDDYKLVCELC
jgi:hypothetical protein